MAVSGYNSRNIWLGSTSVCVLSLDGRPAYACVVLGATPIRVPVFVGLLLQWLGGR